MNSGLTPSQKCSHRVLDPLEEGGRIARDGFDYQDHVAVNKCLDMFFDEGPAEVWCEAEDDIVLVWSAHGHEIFEFVQVKGTDLKQAWTIAKLCAGESTKDGSKKSSIVEKSLSHDRGLEDCRFRVVTQWAPESLLDVLLSGISARKTSELTRQLLTKAATEIGKALGPVTSPNGNGLAYWVERTVWEHRSSVRDLKNDNIVKLGLILDKNGAFLAPDQCDELHASLYKWVQDASLAHGRLEKEKKRLAREELRSRLLSRVRNIQHPTHSGGAGPLHRKLSDAGVDATSIEVAMDLRRRYAAERRTPKYIPADDRDFLEGEVLATLHYLKGRLDAGEFPDDGQKFLARCHAELKILKDSIPGKAPESIIYGYMYEVMNRCMHRLARIST